MTLDAQFFFVCLVTSEFALCTYFPRLNWHKLNMDRLKRNTLVLKYSNLHNVGTQAIIPAVFIIFFETEPM
jgi:hypothetical protein